MYEIEFSEGIEEDLKKLRSFDQRRILGEIEKQLKDKPAVETKNRRLLEGLVPPFEAVPPVWELRVGEYRVFFDVSEDEKKVFVRAVRHKPPHRTTEEIL